MSNSKSGKYYFISTFISEHISRFTYFIFNLLVFSKQRWALLEDLTQDELQSLNDEEMLISTIANGVELVHSADLLDLACDENDEY